MSYINNSKLKSLFVERVSQGLKRKSLVTPSKWACSVRVMGPPFPGPWTFKWHPWLREMHDSKAEMNIGQKGAQLGFTETVLNLTFFKIDIEGVDCLYVLPAKTPDAGDFSAGRFDPALELSPHLSKLFSDVKNVGHKRAGTANLYVRGSKSRAGLKSIPTGFIVLDEVDEFNQKNIPLAFERAAGQVKKQGWMISTPTIENFGINQHYLQSTQEEFFFHCPSCSRLTTLMFPDCLEVTAETTEDININKSFLKCKECKATLNHGLKYEWLETGQWVPTWKQRDSRGFHINQLYSSTVSPVTLARSYLNSLRDPAEEQSFYNDKMGVPHAVEGAKVLDRHLDACRSAYSNGLIDPRHIVTMGIDVGKFLHYEVDSWHSLGTGISSGSVDINTESEVRVLEIGKVANFEELDILVQKHRVNAIVIDASPERRKAYEFASRFFGHVKMCFYGQGIQGKQVTEGSLEHTNEPLIFVDRTSWLDLSLSRFRNQTIKIPQNTPLEYREHVKCLVRTYEKDKDGNPIGRYLKGGGDDHYAHARNYAEIALQFALKIGVSKNIQVAL